MGNAALNTSNQPSTPLAAVEAPGEASLPTHDEAMGALARMFRSASMMSGSERVLVLLADRAKGSFEGLPCSHGYDEGEAASYKIPMWQGPCGQVFRSGESTIVTPEQLLDPDFVTDNPILVQASRYGSGALITPIIHRDSANEAPRNIGIIVYLDKKTDPIIEESELGGEKQPSYTEQDVKNLERFRTQAAQMLVYANFFPITTAVVDQFEATLQSMSIGCLALNDEGVAFQANDGMQPLRVTQHDIGKHFEHIFREAPPFFVEMLRNVYANQRREINQVNLDVADEEGKTSSRKYQVQIDPTFIEQGDQKVFAGAVVVLFDVTSLEEQGFVQESLLAQAAHDLRTPLTPIQGWAFTLKSLIESTEDLNTIREDLVEGVNTILENADRMLRLLADTLDGFRLLSGHTLQVDPQPFELRPCLTELIQHFSARSPACRLVLEMPEDITTLVADKGRLEQILSNFLSNAQKYSPNGGTITVSVQEEPTEDHGSFLKIAVSDQGIGIPADQVEKVFGKLFRVDSEKHKGLKGTGVGLFLSKNLAELHGGSVGVESEYGKGSTFFVKLPANGPAESSENT